MTKKKYRAELFRSPIRIPEGSSGKVRVAHRSIPKGESVPVVGIRQAITRGVRPVSTRLVDPLIYHELSHEDHGTWMTDLPEELNQIGELLHDVEPSGRVLVGGLGLGILASTLAARDDVSIVTVVEIDPDVVALCSRPGYEVVVSDVARFLKKTPRAFDYYLLDTWQTTNEGAWWSTVMPLRRLMVRCRASQVSTVSRPCGSRRSSSACASRRGAPG